VHFLDFRVEYELDGRDRLCGRVPGTAVLRVRRNRPRPEDA
jgi:hypothetical protein